MWVAKNAQDLAGSWQDDYFQKFSSDLQKLRACGHMYPGTNQKGRHIWSIPYKYASIHRIGFKT